MSEISTDVEQEKSKAYIVHKLMAVILDVLVVVAFVAIGTREHNIDATFGYGVITGLPFVAAFFVVQAVIATDLRSMKSAFISSIISIPIAIAIRISLPQIAGRGEYEFKPIFGLIALVFLTLFWVGWRFLLGKMRPSTSSK